MFFDKQFVSDETDYRRERLRSDFASANRPRGSIPNSVVARSAILVGIALLVVISLGRGEGPALSAPADNQTDITSFTLPLTVRVK